MLPASAVYRFRTTQLTSLPRYTSLGSTHDTFPNPTLRSLDEASTWHPAWMLADESLERAGREGGAANGTPAPSETPSKPVDLSRA